MKSYIVEGGKQLEGVINISGSKNAALPIIAASLLNKGIVEIDNQLKIIFGPNAKALKKYISEMK